MMVMLILITNDPVSNDTEFVYICQIVNCASRSPDSPLFGQQSTKLTATRVI